MGVPRDRFQSAAFLNAGTALLYQLFIHQRNVLAADAILIVVQLRPSAAPIRPANRETQVRTPC
jgi:hypothetical protein